MAKSYEVLHDTRLRGRAYASGSYAILGDEDAEGYIRAGLIKGDVPAQVESVQAEPEAPKVEAVAEPKPEPAPKKKKKD